MEKFKSDILLEKVLNKFKKYDEEINALTKVKNELNDYYYEKSKTVKFLIGKYLPDGFASEQYVEEDFAEGSLEKVAYNELDTVIGKLEHNKALAISPLENCLAINTLNKFFTAFAEFLNKTTNTQDFNAPTKTKTSSSYSNHYYNEWKNTFSVRVLTYKDKEIEILKEIFDKKIGYPYTFNEYVKMREADSFRSRYQNIDKYVNEFNNEPINKLLAFTSEVTNDCDKVINFVKNYISNDLNKKQEDEKFPTTTERIR